MKTNVLSFILIFTSLLPTLVLASNDYEEVSYENLLKELQRQETRHVITEDPFEKIKIHAGIGLISSVVNVSTPSQDSYVYQNGVQLSLGIDLLSPATFAEGTFRNYGQNNYGSENFNLKEFELKLFFQKPIRDMVRLRIGGGLAARYLTIENKQTGESNKTTTPDSVFTVGLDSLLSDSLSMGVDFSGRNRMTASSSDKYSLDMTLRLDTHF